MEDRARSERDQEKVNGGNLSFADYIRYIKANSEWKKDCTSCLRFSLCSRCFNRRQKGREVSIS